jgi:hypothetical protein
MKILIACEFSGRATQAFRNTGHDAYSCDLLPTEGNPAWHIQDDALQVAHSQQWDMMIAFPPCTYLSCAGLRWWHNPGRAEKREDALQFVRDLMDAPVPQIAIENPQGAIGSNIRKADQYVQPFQFGDPYIKRTGLWLTGLPLLEPTDLVEPVGHWMTTNSERKTGKPDGLAGRNKRLRSLTFPGIARAMADQWAPTSLS